MDPIKKLFDYQRFAPHEGLARMIEDVGEKYLGGGVALEDEDLELNAAGSAFAGREGRTDANDPETRL